METKNKRIFMICTDEEKVPPIYFKLYFNTKNYEEAFKLARCVNEEGYKFLFEE